ncbi:hypothetical protein MTO96_016571 [Rhipicephalus appendiculatus]
MRSKLCAMDGSGAFGRIFDSLNQMTSASAVSWDTHAFAAAAAAALVVVTVCYLLQKRRTFSDSRKVRKFACSSDRNGFDFPVMGLFVYAQSSAQP